MNFLLYVKMDKNEILDGFRFLGKRTVKKGKPDTYSEDRGKLILLGLSPV
jgi:hypothetical protein